MVPDGRQNAAKYLDGNPDGVFKRRSESYLKAKFNPRPLKVLKTYREESLMGYVASPSKWSHYSVTIRKYFRVCCIVGALRYKISTNLTLPSPYEQLKTGEK